MSTFNILSNTTSTQFEIDNPTFDRTLDTIFISEGSLLTVNADFGWNELKLGDYSGSATDKYGRITDDGSAHTITIGNRCIPYSIGGALNSIDFTNQSIIMSSAHSFIDGYQSGTIDCSLNLDGCDFTNTPSYKLFPFIVNQTITGNWTINNCTYSGVGVFYCNPTVWTMQGDLTITNNTFTDFTTISVAFSPQISGDFDMSDNIITGNIYMPTMTFSGAFKMDNNKFSGWVKMPTVYYQQLDLTVAELTVPEAITLTLADGADGTLDVTIPSISGNPQPVCELALRVGAAPDFTDYILGRFAESQTISIGAWNNAGTWIRINGGDSVQVLCRCINSTGTTAGTGGTQAVTGGGAGTAPGRPTLTVVYAASGQVTATIGAGSPAGASYRVYYRQLTDSAWTAASALSVGANTISGLSNSKNYIFYCQALNAQGSLGAATQDVLVYMSDSKLNAILEGIKSRLQTQITDVADRNILITENYYVPHIGYPQVLISATSSSSGTESGSSAIDFEVTISAITDLGMDPTGETMAVGDVNNIGCEYLGEKVFAAMQNHRSSVSVLMPNLTSQDKVQYRTEEGFIGAKSTVYTGRIYR